MSEAATPGFPDTPPSLRLRAGMRIGGYEVLARLKSGGMGTLYVAKREGPEGFERTIALKVVHPHLAEDEAFVKMFVREASLAARISHPNVVHVEELGHEGDVWFQAMELVRGGSLADLLRAIGKADRMLEVSCAVAIACAIADGLHAAHELEGDDGRPLEVVHRDVSPQNVLLSTSGHVKLTDFGVAKARIGATKSTTGGLRGKIAYMPPEQAYGRRIDRRADVYALGVVLWEMLTLRRLFYAPDPLALLDRVRAPVVPAPSELRPDLDPALDAAVLWALAADPQKRAPTARALRQRLAELPGIRPVGPDELGQLVRSVLAPQIPVVVSASQPLEATDDPVEAERALQTLTVPTATAATADLRPTFEAIELDASSEEDESPPAAMAEPAPPVHARGIALVVAGVAAIGAAGLAIAFFGGGETPAVETAPPPSPVALAASLDASSAVPIPEPEPPAAPDASVALAEVAPEAEDPPSPPPPRRRRAATPPRAQEEAVEESLVEGVPIFDDQDFH